MSPGPDSLTLQLTFPTLKSLNLQSKQERGALQEGYNPLFYQIDQTRPGFDHLSYAKLLG